MPLRTIRSKLEKASKKIETLLHKARKARAECVLVVYGGEEANIYYENDAGLQKQSR